jgi:hypothetical protein
MLYTLKYLKAARCGLLHIGNDQRYDVYVNGAVSGDATP